MGAVEKERSLGGVGGLPGAPRWSSSRWKEEEKQWWQGHLASPSSAVAVAGGGVAAPAGVWGRERRSLTPS